MDNMTLVLSGVLLLLAVVYFARRRSRLMRED